MKPSHEQVLASLIKIGHIKFEQGGALIAALAFGFYLMDYVFSKELNEIIRGTMPLSLSFTIVYVVMACLIITLVFAVMLVYDKRIAEQENQFIVPLLNYRIGSTVDGQIDKKPVTLSLISISTSRITRRDTFHLSRLNQSELIIYTPTQLLEFTLRRNLEQPPVKLSLTKKPATRKDPTFQNEQPKS